MHLIVPFAGTVSEAGRQALGTLVLPRLERLLERLAPAQTLGSDEYSLSPTHEVALAVARGWPPSDGALPWAADAAIRAGIDPGDRAWALFTPVHLNVEVDRVTLTDPLSLGLDGAASRALLETVRPLFESEGFELHWLAPGEWLASHALFDGLATASLDRVLGRNIDPWLPDQRQARLLRRLQNEVQMLLHTHALNEQREADGQLVVNSFWCHGCGRAAASTPAPSDLRLDDRLRAPSLAGDWAAWAEAWAALDAGPLADMLERADTVRLTLCGERRAMRFEPAPRSLWKRLAAPWQRRPAAHWLEAL